MWADRRRPDRRQNGGQAPRSSSSSASASSRRRCSASRQASRIFFSSARSTSVGSHGEHFEESSDHPIHIAESADVEKSTGDAEQCTADGIVHVAMLRRLS